MIEDCYILQRRAMAKSHKLVTQTKQTTFMIAKKIGCKQRQSQINGQFAKVWSQLTYF